MENEFSSCKGACNIHIRYNKNTILGLPSLGGNSSPRKSPRHRRPLNSYTFSPVQGVLFRLPLALSLVRSLSLSPVLSHSHPQVAFDGIGNEERKGKKSKRKRRKWNFFEGIPNTRMSGMVG